MGEGDRQSQSISIICRWYRLIRTTTEESVDRFGSPLHIFGHEQVTRCSPSTFRINLMISVHAIRPTSPTYCGGINDFIQASRNPCMRAVKNHHRIAILRRCCRGRKRCCTARVGRRRGREEGSNSLEPFSLARSSVFRDALLEQLCRRCHHSKQGLHNHTLLQ